jgi:hypothetical protein
VTSRPLRCDCASQLRCMGAREVRKVDLKPSSSSGKGRTRRPEIEEDSFASSSPTLAAAMPKAAAQARTSPSSAAPALAVRRPSTPRAD